MFSTTNTPMQLYLLPRILMHILNPMTIRTHRHYTAMRSRLPSGGKTLWGDRTVDGIMLCSWMLQHSAHSECLPVEIAKWVGWLSNGSPPYAAYWVLNMVRDLAADKCLEVQPLGCRETWMHLIANCNLMQSREMATVAYSNTQLCAGLIRSGIEASLHAV